VVGSTGNIGVSAVKAALNTKRKVLAIVRNQNSADKLLKHLGISSSDAITFVEANVLSDSGVRGVVDQVKAGKLPAFQHVYACGQHTPYFTMSNKLLTPCISRWRVHHHPARGDHHQPATLQLQRLLRG
jgi:NAD(P)-dependent dehydrogenase (short-subunit alcohol dehydrogenase family)